MIHVANLKAPLGWERFSHQKAFSVGGLYWLCPEIVAIMADHAGFSVVAGSAPHPENEYLNRDYIAVLERYSHEGRCRISPPGHAAQEHGSAVLRDHVSRATTSPYVLGSIA